MNVCLINCGCITVTYLCYIRGILLTISVGTGLILVYRLMCLDANTVVMVMVVMVACICCWERNH